MSGARVQAPYGSWKSPISASMIADTTISLDGVFVDNGQIYWLERRPSEGGRVVLVGDVEGSHTDITPEGYSVRTQAHEYGGGALHIHDGTIYFVNAQDQHIYRHKVDEPPQVLTGSADDRFADMIVDVSRARLICARERHGAAETANALIAIGLSDGAVTELDSSHDFISNPRISPDGTRLAWQSWDLPDMPWDGATLWVADLAADGKLGEVLKVAGGAGEAAFQPEWRPDGSLVFALDRTGWWNLHVWDGETVSILIERDAEFGLPQWNFGMRT